MCFGGNTTTPPDNPAPTPLDQTQKSVQETKTSAAPGQAVQGALSPQAAAKDPQDQSAAPVNGYAISSGLATSTL